MNIFNQIKILIITSLLLLSNIVCFGENSKKSFNEMYEGLTGNIFLQMCLDNGIDLKEIGTEFSLFEYAFVQGWEIDPNVQFSDRGYDLLYLALIVSDFEKIKELIKNGININCEYIISGYKFSPLIIAVGRGNLQIIEALIEAGADLSYKSCKVSDNKAKVVFLNGDVFIFDKNFEKDESVRSIASLAVVFGKLDVVKLLVKYNVDFLAPTLTDEGIDFLENDAIRKGNKDIADFIIELRNKQSSNL